MTGISVRAQRDPREAKLHALTNETSRLPAEDGREAPREAFTVEDGYVGPGYSRPTEEMTAAIHMFARLEGILLDPVYTGKTAAGMVGLVQQGRFAPDSTVLSIHTGGSPALYAYPDSALGSTGG